MNKEPSHTPTHLNPTSYKNQMLEAIECCAAILHKEFIQRNDISLKWLIINITFKDFSIYFL